MVSFRYLFFSMSLSLILVSVGCVVVVPLPFHRLKNSLDNVECNGEGRNVRELTRSYFTCVKNLLFISRGS